MRILGILIAAVFCVGYGNAWFPARVGRNAPVEHEKLSRRRRSGDENRLNRPGGGYAPLSSQVPPIGAPWGLPWKRYDAQLKPQIYHGENTGQSWPNHEDDWDYVREHHSRRPEFYPEFPKRPEWPKLQWPDLTTTQQRSRGGKHFQSAARETNFEIPDLEETIYKFIQLIEEGGEHYQALKEFIHGLNDLTIEKGIIWINKKGSMENTRKRWFEYFKTKGVEFLKAHGNNDGKEIANEIKVFEDVFF